MNEDFLNHIYTTLYKDKVDYNTFKSDFIGNEDFIKHVFDQLGYEKKGVTMDQFKNDLGISPNNVNSFAQGISSPKRDLSSIISNMRSSKSTTINDDLSDESLSPYIKILETDDNYSKLNPETSATGGYQHMWSIHSDAIKRMTGIDNVKDYINNPEAQDTYQKHLNNQYRTLLPRLKKISIENGRDWSDKELAYIMHHSWLEDGAKFLRGDTTIPGYKGLMTRLMEGRKRGLSGPINLSNSTSSKENQSIEDSLKDLQLVSVPLTLPRRNNKIFKSKVDINLINKLDGLLQDNDLVITETNDAKDKNGNSIHKDPRQRNGLSVDVNFNDKNQDPEKIKKAIIDAKNRGLEFVFEHNSPVVIDSFKKRFPDLEKHFKYVSSITAPHFSVYHDSNYEIQNSSLLQNTSAEKAAQLRAIQANAYQEAYDKYGETSMLQSVSSLSSTIAETFSPLFGGTAKAANEVIQNTTDVRANLKRVLDDKFKSGELLLSDFSNEELLFLYEEKEHVDDLKERSKKSKEYLNKQLKDEGLFESLGDSVAGTIMDDFFGGFSGKSGSRLDTKDGKINILPPDRYNMKVSPDPAIYLDPTEIMKLKVSPYAKSDDPNDPANKHLRRVQKILSTPESLAYAAATRPLELRLEIAQEIIEKTNDDIKKLKGEKYLETFYELNVKNSNGEATPEEVEQLTTMTQELQGAGINFENLNIAVDNYNNSINTYKNFDTKFGVHSKFSLLEKSRVEDADNIDRAIAKEAKSWKHFFDGLERIAEGSADILVSGIPELTKLAGAGIETVTGANIGATDAIKRTAQTSLDVIKSSNKTKSATSYDLDIDGYVVSYNGKGEPQIYKDGYLVRDENTIKRLKALASKQIDEKYDGDFKNLGLTYSGLAIWEGVVDTAPQLIGIWGYGGLAKTIGAKISRKIVERGARNGIVANTLNNMATSGKLTSSLGTIPTFAGDFMKEAVDGGATTAGQIFTTTAFKLGQEALAESLFEGPIGKLLSDKGITKGAFSKFFKDSLEEKVRGTLKNLGRGGRLTAKDLANHVKDSVLELAKDAAGEGFEEFIVEATTPDLNAFLNNILETKYESDYASSTDLMNSTLVGMAAGGLMGGGGLIKNLVNAKESIRDAYDLELADVISQNASALVKNETLISPEAFKEMTKPLVEKGLITQELANNYYSAVQEASERTKFLKDIDTKTTFFNDNDIDAKEKFMNFSRNLAFNRSMLARQESNNAIEKELNSKKVETYDKILNQLETNSFAGVFTATTPYRIGRDASINISSENMSKLERSQQTILDEVNKTNFNQSNKQKYYNLLLHKKALELKKQEENLTPKEQEVIDSKVESVNNLIKKVEKEQKVEDDIIAVKSGKATDEQINKAIENQKAAVDDYFNLYDQDISSSEVSDDMIASLREKNNLVGDYIDQKLNERGLKKFVESKETLEKQQSRARPIKNENLDTRYAEAPELEAQEGPVFEKDYENYIKSELVLVERQLEEEANTPPEERDPSLALKYNTLRMELDHITDPTSDYNKAGTASFRDKFNSHKPFRDFVIQKTQEKPQVANYTTPKSTSVKPTESRSDLEDVTLEKVKLEGSNVTRNYTRTKGVWTYVDLGGSKNVRKKEFIEELDELATEKFTKENSNISIQPVVEPVPESTSITELEAKIAEIERRRQEELKNPIKTTEGRKETATYLGEKYTIQVFRGAFQTKYSVEVSQKDNTVATGYKSNESLSKNSFDTYEEALEYANKIAKKDKENLDKINAKYDAELKALENSNNSGNAQYQQSEIEVKKADIERRRQEKLLGKSFTKTTEKVVTGKGQSAGKTIVRFTESKVSSNGEVLTIKPKAKFKNEDASLSATPETITVKEFKKQFYENLSEQDKEMFDEFFTDDSTRIKLVEARIGLKGNFKGQVNIDIESLKGQPFGFELQNGKEINAEYDAELAKELYKEMLSGKQITEFTTQEQQILANPNIFNQELRDVVDTELKALEEESSEENLKVLDKKEEDLKEPINSTLENEETSIPQIEVQKVEGTLTISVNGYLAQNLKDNKLVSDYLKAGDPIYYELISREGKDSIEAVVYFKNNKFVDKNAGGRRIILGSISPRNRGENAKQAKELIEYLKQISSKSIKGIITTDPSTYKDIGNAKGSTRKNLTQQEIELLRPSMYVIGKSYVDGRRIILLNKDVDGDSFLSIEKFIDNYIDENPKYKHLESSLLNFLTNLDDNHANGKVFSIVNGQIILFDSPYNRDIPEHVIRIKQRIAELSTSDKYKSVESNENNNGYIQVSSIDLSDIVSKRDFSLPDVSTSSTPNINGKLIQFYAAGSKKRSEQLENNEELKPVYKLVRDQDSAEVKEVYLTEEQVVEELLNIRANVDSNRLRQTTLDPEYNDYLSKILSTNVSPGYTIYYNIVEGQVTIEKDEKTIVDTVVLSKTEDPIINEPTPQSIQQEVQEINDVVNKNVSDKDSGKNKSNRDIDFKISEQDYEGKVEKAVIYLKDRFEEIGIEVNDNVLRNLVKGTAAEGSKVWGAFHNAMVTLSALSGENIGRHESIHVAEIMFHTDAQIKAFRQEALSRYGKELGISKTNVDDLTDEELTQIREKLATVFENYKNTLLLPEGFSKKYPTISKFIENLFNFLKKNYLIGRSYITNKKSIDQLFYEVENNILGRDFLGRRKKSARDIFQKALDRLSNSNKTDFKVSDWIENEVYEFGDFIAKDMLNLYLKNKYGDLKSLTEVLEHVKDLNANDLFKDFRDNLKDLMESYKESIIKDKKLKKGTSEYHRFINIVDDIFNEYNSDTKNIHFERIVNQKLKQRVNASDTLTQLERANSEEPDLLNESEVEQPDTETESYRESWQVKNAKTDIKTKSSARLREFFSSIPLKVRIVKDGKSYRRSIFNKLLFNDLYYSGNYIHNKLLLELSDNSNYEDFITKLNSLVDKYQFAGDIIGKILNLNEQEIAEAYDDGTLQLPLDIITNEASHPNFNMWLLKDMYQTIADQTNENPIKILTRKQGNNVVRAQALKLVKDTDLKNTIQSISDTILAKLDDPIKFKELLDSIDEVLDNIEYEKPTALSIYNFLPLIGYSNSSELLIHLQSSVNLTGKRDNIRELSLILKDLKRSIENKDATKFIQSDSNIQSLARLLSTYGTVSSGLSYMNVENENEFSHRNSNFLSRINAIWKKGLNSTSSNNIKSWVKSMTKSTKVVENQELTYDVLGHFRNPGYQDLVNPNFKYKLFEDGFAEIENQKNTGKAYSNYSPEEVLASNINMFLTHRSGAKEAGTIEKGVGTIPHALYFFGVFADSGNRKGINAPIFSLDTISNKLTQMIYGELERIMYISNGTGSEFKNLKEAGKFFQNIPEMEQVYFVTPEGNKTSMKDYFLSKKDGVYKMYWKDFNSTQIGPKISKIGYFNKLTREFEEVDVTNFTYKGIMKEVISTLLSNNSEGFINLLKNNNFLDDERPIATTSEILLKEYYYNTFYNGIIFGNMFAGDPAHYKKNKNNFQTDVEWFKRFKQLISPNIRKTFTRENFKVLLVNDIELKSDNFIGDASISDAASVHTLDRRIEILKADPDWDLKSTEVMRLYNAIMNNTYTQADLESSYFQTLKPFAYDLVDKEVPITLENGEKSSLIIKVPVQLKNSEAVLLPTEAYEVREGDRYVRPTTLEEITPEKYVKPELAKLLFLMENPADFTTPRIDTVVFTTGSKAEKLKSVDLYSVTDVEAQSAAFNFKNSAWGEQQYNPRKDMSSQVNDGSQVRKIMTANIDPNWKGTFAGTEFQGPQGAMELLMTIERENAKRNLEKIKKGLKDSDDNLVVEKALNIIREGLIEKAQDIETLEGLEILEEDGKTVIPLELMGKKGEHVLNSFYKKLAKFKVKGASLINKSSLGYIKENQELEYTDNLQLITGTDVNGKKIIKYWEAIVPVYDPIIFNYVDKNGNFNYIDENNKLVVNSLDPDLPPIPTKLLDAFFYRIPTEDKYSMFPVRIKRFSMPIEGGNIILPKEATIMSGLDFDIDKLYGYYYNFKESFPPSLEEYVINKFYKDTNIPKKILKDFITFAKENNASEIEDIKEEFPDYYTYYSKFYELLTNPKTKKIVESITSKEEYNRFKDQHKIEVINSSFSSSQAIQNLKLDVYLSLARTAAFAESAFNPGNKDRLVALRDEKQLKKSKNSKVLRSYADPISMWQNASRNIVGKRLIGIFANANSFYNMIQGVAKIELQKPIKLNIFGTTYNIDSLGDVNSQISKNIAELLFASTEDVKDPVLEPLNINEVTANLLITLLSMTGDNGKQIISFEHAIEILSDPTIIKAVKEAQKKGQTLDKTYPKNGPYAKVMEISKEYGRIITAAKIDAPVGPDFQTVYSKIDKIDAIIEQSQRQDKDGRFTYIFKYEGVLDILPMAGSSKIKQLNIYREGLEDEIATFSEIYSFLKPTVTNILNNLRNLSKNNYLNPKLSRKFSYALYDSAIQAYLKEQDILEYLKNDFPKKLASYTFPNTSSELQTAFEVSNNTIKTRFVNIATSGDTLANQKRAFTNLFDTDPQMAKELALYGFLTGTEFSLSSIVKIIPTRFFKEAEGKVIRNIINGNLLRDYLKDPSTQTALILYNHFESIIEDIPVDDKNNPIFPKNPDKQYYYTKATATEGAKLYEYQGVSYILVHEKKKGSIPDYIIENIDETIANEKNDFKDVENVDSMTFETEVSFLDNQVLPETNIEEAIEYETDGSELFNAPPKIDLNDEINLNDTKPDINNDDIEPCSPIGKI